MIQSKNRNKQTTETKQATTETAEKGNLSSTQVLIPSTATNKNLFCIGTILIGISIITVFVGIYTSNKFASLCHSLADESFELLSFPINY